MKIVALTIVFGIALSGAAGAEQRFEVLNLDLENYGDLASAEESSVLEEIQGFYLAGDLELASKYQSGGIRSVANNTGLLEVLYADNEYDGCTATAMTDRLILTNSHCVPSDGPHRAVQAVFKLGYETGDIVALEARRGTDVVLPAREQSEILDYAVLELLEPIPGFVPIRITALRDPAPQEPLLIMGFPGANPLSVSRKNCLSTERPVEAMQFSHLCRTFGGNSGSLIFADDWSLVGLHHAGVYDNETGEKTDLSYGIRITEILAISSLLQSMILVSSPSVVSGLPTEPAVVSAPRDNSVFQNNEAELVKRVQIALIQKGCLGGSADGEIGPRTREAIRRYNQTNESAINADRLRETDPSVILSQLSQSCESATSSVSQICYDFNGSVICD